MNEILSRLQDLSRGPVNAMDAGVSRLVTQSSPADVRDIYLTAACKDVPYFPELELAVAEVCDAEDTFFLNGQRDRILAAYTDSEEPADVDMANRDHVIRLQQSAQKYAGLVGLTQRELLHLRMAILLSDVGKRTAWAQNYMSRPGPWDRLNAVVNWLRYYQRETGGDFTLREEEGNFQPGYSAQLRKEPEPYGMACQPWAEMTRWERSQVQRLISTVYHPDVKFFPEALYLHELPGWVWGVNSFKVPREVLEAIFAHNGPEQIMRAGELGALETYEDVTTDGRPFWGGSSFKITRGSYPLPLKGCLLAILHTMFDRFDQGMLFPDDNGSFVGGIKKIFIQDVFQNIKSPREALRHVLQVLPQDSEGQIHYLWYHRVGGTVLEKRLSPVYFEIVSQLRAVQSMADLVDFDKTSGGENTIHFKDNSRLVVNSMANVESLFGRLRKFHDPCT